MARINVRFLLNFIMEVIQTVEDEQGRLVAQPKSFHIQVGDTYSVSQYTRHPDGRLDLQFPEDSPLAGVANGIEGDYCEMREGFDSPKQTNVTPRSGCGGCQKKKEA